MDATKFPLSVPPAFQVYADKHKLFALFQYLTEKLVIYQPEDPIQFLCDQLKLDNIDVPRAVVIGVFASGKTTLARRLCDRLNCVYVSVSDLTNGAADPVIKQSIENYINKGEAIPVDTWIRSLTERLEQLDCAKCGWILDDFPQTSLQANAMKKAGILPDHCIVLDAPDWLLTDRATGRLIDPDTNDIYHSIFRPPPDTATLNRVVKSETLSASGITTMLYESRHTLSKLCKCFEQQIKIICADQPIDDVFATALAFIMKKPQDMAPHIPRIILVGPPGSGKMTQADLLAEKYNIVPVDYNELIQQNKMYRTKEEYAVKSYFAGSLTRAGTATVKHILGQRLTQEDCLRRGWVLYGFPNNLEQARALDDIGLSPTRVFIFEMPPEASIERLAYRLLDPLTGKYYHQMFNAPPDNIASRLKQHPQDARMEVQRKLVRYNKTLKDVGSYYKIAQMVNADQDANTLFELLQGMLLRQLPKCL